VYGFFNLNISLRMAQRSEGEEGGEGRRGEKRRKEERRKRQTLFLHRRHEDQRTRLSLAEEEINTH
jgi:hypothetical protein